MNGIMSDQGTLTLVSNELGHIFGGRINHGSAAKSSVLESIMVLNVI